VFPAHVSGHATAVGVVTAAAGVALVLIDPPGAPSSRARRYTAHVQPSLFGGIDVFREWERVDTMHRPRRLVTEHESEAAALAALNRVVALRLRRGYRLCSRRRAGK
jgi:predicted DNA-binding WGR domain protein